MVTVSILLSGVCYYGVGLVLTLWAHRLFGVLKLRELSLFSVFYLAYFFILYVPAFPVSLRLEHAVRVEYLSAVALALATILIGATVAGAALDYRRTDAKRFYEGETTGEISIHFKVTFALLLSVAFLLALIHILELPVLPLAQIAQGADRLELTMARAGATKAFETELAFAYAWLGNTIVPFLTLMPLAIWLRWGKRAWLVLYVVITAAAIVYLAIAIQRKPVFLLLAMHALLYYVMRHGRLRRSWYVLAPVGVLAVPYAITLLRGTKSYLVGFERLWGVLYSLVVHRIFVVPADVIASYFEVFPRVLPYLGGGSTPFVASLLGRDWFRVPEYVAAFRGASLATAHANAAFVGFAYADFGLGGVVLFGFLVGALIQVLDVWVLRRKKSLLSYVLLAMLAGASISFLTTAATTVLFSKGLLVALAVVAAFRGVQMLFGQLVGVSKNRS